MRWRAQSFYWNEGAVSGAFCKDIFVADLSRIQYLFEILQTSFTVKKWKSGKNWMFRKMLAIEIKFLA